MKLVIILGSLFFGLIGFGWSEELKSGHKSNFADPEEQKRWSSFKSEVMPDGSAMLVYPREIRFQVSPLREHKFVRVKMKLAVIGGHDGFEPAKKKGPDYWAVLETNGTSIFRTTFRTPQPGDRDAPDRGQSFPDEFPWGRYSGQLGAADIGKLGPEPNGTYELDFIFPHSRPLLSLEFLAGHQNGGDLEQYGILSFEVETVTKAVERTDKEFAELWKKLNGKDPLVAHRARWGFVASGEKGAAYLRDIQKKAEAVANKAVEARAKKIPAEVAKWVGKLDSDEFKERVEARSALKKLPPEAVAELEKEIAKAKTPEVKKSLQTIVKSLTRDPANGGGAVGSHASLVGGRIAHILRLADIEKSGRRLTTSAPWLPLGCLDDDFIPKQIIGTVQPKFTWRRRQKEVGGKDEWVQYDFPEPKTFTSASVFWFQDTGWDEGSKLPASWFLEYKDGDEWKPVKNKGNYTITLNKLDKVTFDPITTKTVRLRAKAQPKHFAGMLEFQLSK